MYSEVNQESVDRSRQYLRDNRVKRQAKEKRKARTREIIIAVFSGLFVYVITNL